MKNQLTAVFITFCLLIGLGSLPASAYTVRNEHPRIYINKDNIDAIYERISNPYSIQSKYYLELKNYADGIMGKDVDIGDRTAPMRLKILAFLYLMGEIPNNTYVKYSIEDFGKKGVEYLRVTAEYYSKNRPDAGYGAIIVQSMSVAYDWLYKKLTDEDKKYIVPRLIKAAEGQKWNLGWQSTFKDYSVGGNNYCIAALAFAGDGINYAKEKEYIENYMNKYRDEFIAGWRFATQGGGSFQGSNGHIGDIPIFLYVMDAFYTAMDIDDIKDFDYLKYIGEWFAYALVPGWNNGNNLFITDNDVIGGRDIGADGVEAMIRVTSYPHFEDKLKSLTTWVLEPRAIKPSPESPHWTAYNYDYKLMHIIWCDDNVIGHSPKELGYPLARHFGVLDNGTGHPGGVGIAIMKSAWDDPGATFAAFKARPFKYTHDDHDSNSFVIHKKGLLAIDSGQYENGDWWNYELNYDYRTIAHNSMLIVDPKENFGNGTANDGGQRLPQQFHSRNFPQDYKVGGPRDVGGMVRFETVPGMYDYMRGDATRAYQSTLFTDAGNRAKISLFTRDFVYLRSSDGNNDYFVVFDKVNSTDPSFKKKWLLHSIEVPEFNGKFTAGGLDGKGAANKFGGTPGSISYDADMVIIAENNGKLFSKTILPEAHAITKVGGPDAQGAIDTKGSYESYVDGTNYKMDGNYKFNRIQGSWRIEVEPTVAQKEDLFLHVLYPCDQKVTAMPQAKKIETTSKNMIGVHIVAVEDVPHWVVLFSKNTSEITGTDFRITGSGALRILLADMKKNASYEVSQNGTVLTTKSASDQGTLYIEASLTDGENNFMISEKKEQRSK